jgi:hypothetical protein
MKVGAVINNITFRGPHLYSGIIIHRNEKGNYWVLWSDGDYVLYGPRSLETLMLRSK